MVRPNLLHRRPTPAHSGQCPDCLTVLRESDVWCPACEWNLESGRVEFRADAPRWERRAHTLAADLNRSVFTELAGQVPERAHASRTARALTAVSVALLVVDLVLLGGGVWLLLQFPKAWFVAGLLMVLVAIELRPRIPRHRDVLGRTTRADAPALFALLDRLAADLGAPVPDVVMIRSDVNAFTMRSGFRRRTVLGLGLPLWWSLSTPGRAALLGHELGHQVNGDPTHGLLHQVGLHTFARLRALCSPSDKLVVKLTVGWLMWLAHRLFGGLQLAVSALAGRDSQRAEYHADWLAVQLGGTVGATELTETLVRRDEIHVAAWRCAKQQVPPSHWAAAAAERRQALRPTLLDAERRSIASDASLFHSHPPNGYRLRMVRSWPTTVGRASATPAQWAAAEADLERLGTSVPRRLLQQGV